MNTGSPKDAAALVSVVAQNIRSRRTARGLSLGELAALAGVGKSTLSMLEAGKGNPSIETLLATNALIREVNEALGGQGRVLVRYSGTENKARVMVEGPNMGQTRRFAQDIAACIEEELG